MTRTALPGDTEGEQSRYVEAAFGGGLIGYLYLPNGNPQPGSKFEHKLNWFERLIRHGRSLAGVPVVLAGDYNVVPTVFDIYEYHSDCNDALLLLQDRKAYARLLKQG